MSVEIAERHELYLKKIFSWIQVEDCIEGSDAIKLKNELYLPMPAGFDKFDNAPDTVRTNQTNKTLAENMNAQAPFFHTNKAYQSYLQRGRFPDVVNNIMRGFLGLISSEAPKMELPSSIEYLENQATIDGTGITELYADIVCKILASGKVSLLVDVRPDGTLYFVAYPARSNINWSVQFVDGEQVLKRVVFEEKILNTNGDEDEGYKEYIMASIPVGDQDSTQGAVSEKEFYTVNTYDNDGNLTNSVNPSLFGNMLEEIPMISIGSVKNTVTPDMIPLLGLSDIALTMYRENSDLHQAHFMTCNPTLFLFGVEKEEVPRSIGSTAAIAISDPNARAMYPATDTSALEHIRLYIGDLNQEAVQQSVKFLGDKSSAESGEALRRRENAQSTDLVHIVHLAGKGIEQALNLSLKWLQQPEEAEFVPSTEFGRLVLDAQEQTALVASWLKGAISHDTVLDRFRDGGLIDENVSNEEEKKKIELSAPALPSAGGTFA